MTEQQNIEYKQSWRDEHLKWICGFANAQGGKLFIGVNDTGAIVGLDEYKKLLDDIPNKIVNHLGLVVDVNLHESENKQYIEINVPVSSVPVAFHGVYHYRSGSTKQELKGNALQELLLKKMGRKWEDIPLDGISLKDINRKTLQLFIDMAIDMNRITPAAAKMEMSVVLRNLELMTEEGRLTNAAILLFGKHTPRVSVTASFKIGRFGKASHDLLFHDIVETNIFEMADHVMDLLKSKYLIRPVSYRGLERVESLEYPETALREAILNAIIHKDYSSTYIFLRVYDDRLRIWNPGKLPDHIDIEKLKKEHSSYPRNRNIANVFFKAGFIESWGRGMSKIVDSCIDAGLPEPVIEEDQGGFCITFFKDQYTEEFINMQVADPRKREALLYILTHGSISNAQYQQLAQVSKRTATRDLQELTEEGYIKMQGHTGKGTSYIFCQRNEIKGAIKGPKQH